jgi:hypothetical protein
MISAADMYPEFVGVDPAPKAKLLLARAANRTPAAPKEPVASSARRGASGGSGNNSNNGGKSFNLTAGQKIFVDTLASLSGLDKYVIAAWAIAENGYGNSSASQGREGSSNHNWLNVGWFDAGRGGITYDGVWGTAEKGARATNDFLRGKKFGPSSGILQIIKTAGQSPQNQIQAIVSSGWASSGYAAGGTTTIAQIYNEITGSNIQVVAGGAAGTTTGGGGVTGGIDAAGAQTVGTAAAFGVVLEGPTSEDRQEAMQLQGQKSYMNDKPLIDFIEQLCSASMHHFQSLPDGRFYAFFPDYFGSFNHRAPYWEIDDVEIIDMTMYLSDESLATHVYVVGDTMLAGTSQSPVSPQFVNRLNSNGVVSIFDAFNLNWLTESKSPVFSNPNQFLERYGVRPYYEDAPYVHAPFFEIFVAFQKFMLLWARQFLTNCEFTFMPEMYPGGRVAFKDRGVVCYVDSVKHEFDYENGFTTTAQLSAPSADVNSKVTYPLGMVRPSTGGSAG